MGATVALLEGLQQFSLQAGPYVEASNPAATLAALVESLVSKVCTPAQEQTPKTQKEYATS